MKTLLNINSALIWASVLFFFISSNVVQAQWITHPLNPNIVHTSDRVGIGTNQPDPSARFHINGGVKIGNNSLLPTNRWSTYVMSLPPVGILGTQGSFGLSMAWNGYRRVDPDGENWGGWEVEGTGFNGEIRNVGSFEMNNYGMFWNYDVNPQDGFTPTPRMSISTDGIVNIRDGMRLGGGAQFYSPDLGPWASHIHYGLKGDWYIRSADSTGRVYIQDIGGAVVIGSKNPSNFTGKLDIYSTTESERDNNVRFQSPNLGRWASHIHYGRKGDWYIRSANTSGKVVIQDQGGNVGIGLSNPNAKLSVAGRMTVMSTTGNKTNVDLRGQFNHTNTGAWMALRDNGHERISFAARNSSTNRGGLIDIKNNSGSNTIRLIGDTGGGRGRMTVDGQIYAEEIRVALSQNWPDYVFEDAYELPSLDQVESYIDTHKHLPGIPSAKEVEEEGIELGEMQRKMMEKIEELTLYMIDLKKENEALKTRLEQLEK